MHDPNDRAFWKARADERKARKRAKANARVSVIGKEMIPPTRRPIGKPTDIVRVKSPSVIIRRPYVKPREGVMEGIRAPIMARRPSVEPREGVMVRKAPKIIKRPPGYPREGVMVRKAPKIIKRPPGYPRREVMMDRPPRKVGVGREQAKIEPAGLSAKIAAIVNSIIDMITGRR